MSGSPFPRPLLAATEQAPAQRIEPAGGRSGFGVPLLTTPAAAAAIRSGIHQVRTVAGRALTYPSQNLSAIESSRPDMHGQTHGVTEHIGTSLAANVGRLERDPSIRAAGGYTDLAAAQRATDRTIANPANQAAIGAFLADPGRLKTALARVDLGEAAGTSTLRVDLDAGRPGLVPGTTATVVLIKDPTFPEGYRVLTTYPDTRPAEVDPQGNRLP